MISHVLGKIGTVTVSSMNIIYFCVSGTEFYEELVQVMSFTKQHRRDVYSIRLSKHCSPDTSLSSTLQRFDQEREQNQSADYDTYANSGVSKSIGMDLRRKNRGNVAKQPLLMNKYQMVIL